VVDGAPAYLPFRDELTALDPDRYPAIYIDAQVWSGAWQCWGDGKAAILAEIKTYPSGIREVHGIAAAGDLQSIKALIPLAEAWGKENGCARAVIDSRPGWERALPDYEIHQVSIRKDI
jgi:hypothetical protein